jgi:hypothetical protein
MKTRCYNASPHNFPYYQGKGIKICKEWLDDIKAFVLWGLSTGWKKGLSIDRIDSNKDYSADNCQWMTVSDNSKKRIKEYGFSFPIKKKLSIDQVSEVNAKLKSGMNGMAIAKLFGVEKKVIYRIRDNKY